MAPLINSPSFILSLLLLTSGEYTEMSDVSNYNANSLLYAFILMFFLIICSLSFVTKPNSFVF